MPRRDQWNTDRSGSDARDPLAGPERHARTGRNGSTHSPFDDPRLNADAKEFVADPASALASVLVHRMLAASPGAREVLSRDGIVVIVEVPSDEWIDPVADACWLTALKLGCRLQHGDDEPEADETTSKATPQWLEFRRPADPRKGPMDGNAQVRRALAAGQSICGFSASSKRYLPRDLLRAADLRLTLPSVDADVLAETVAVVVGEWATTPSPRPEVASAVTIDDVQLARRPNQSADEYMAKICALAEQKLQVSSVTLDSLHGMDAAVCWGHDLARDLCEYRSGALPWSAVDRGALLYGPPGTGKTTFARALAATCAVPLVVGSLSQWQAAGTGHLGDLLQAMRRTFADARAAAPSILFVDEVDSFGNRSSFKHHYRDYSTQVVNGFLEELDGVTARVGVVVLGACNHPDMLDPAIVRSGRLDRVIPVPLPNAEALAKILRVHLGADLAGADLTGAALLALGGSGADCERWVRGARRRARHAARDMQLEDLVAEIRGNETGRPSGLLRRSAIHEAGHALVTALEMPPGTLLKVSIRQTGPAGGLTLTAPLEETVASRAGLEASLRQLLAGRAAEEVVFGEASAGAGGGPGSDLAKATVLATALVCSLGLDAESDGLLWTALPDADNLARLLSSRPEVAKRVSALLDAAYEGAKKVVAENRGLLERLAELLMEKGTVEGKEVEAMLGAA